MRLRLPVRSRHFYAAPLEEYADGFDGAARQALSFADEEAQHRRDFYLGPEHLLLGLLRVPDSTAGRALNLLGLSSDRVRESVEFIVGPGSAREIGARLPTPRARKVIAITVQEAKRDKAAEAGTEYLLLGLVREGEGISAGLLESLGANERRVREAIAHIKHGSAAPEPLPEQIHRQHRVGPVARHLEQAQRTIAWVVDVERRSQKTARVERLQRIADDLRALIDEDVQAVAGDADQSAGDDA